MKIDFTLTTEISAKPDQIYNAWLDSKAHNEMTEGEGAIQSHTLGAIQKAHGNYIWGKNLELVPYSKIAQSWRTLAFVKSDEDSIVEVRFEEQNGKTKLTLIHTNVPEKEFHVKKGWVDHYFEPMQRYFSSKRNK